MLCAAEAFKIAFTLIEKRSMPNDMGREDVPEENMRGMKARRCKKRVVTSEGRRIPRSVGRCDESHPE
jgi:hypothetical protein